MEPMKWTDLQDNICPVARSLSILGDRWTLLIVRDCFLGLSKFDEFQKSIGVTRHILADRLKKLVETGVLEKRPYQDRPPRHDYVLTDRGKELGPALMVLRDWGKAHLPVRRRSTHR